MSQKPPRPYFDPRIFWDVDHTKMDYELRANFIIERVFERGDVEDIRWCRRFYGDERIGTALTKAKWLSIKTIHLAAAVLDKELNEFRCYNIAQSDPNYFTY